MRLNKEQLWCVHVLGPDEIHPTESWDDAVELATDLNAGSDAFNSHLKPSERVMYTAQIEVWTDGPELHEHFLKKRLKRDEASTHPTGDEK